MNKLLLLLLTFLVIACNTEENKDLLDKETIKADLAYFDKFLQDYSSYQGLNGYDYQKDFKDYLAQLNSDKISKAAFGKFLSSTIGKIGDRHSYIRGYDLPNSIYFPLAFAPYDGKIAVLNRDTATKKYKLWNAEFPYLKAIENKEIVNLLPQIVPEEIKAPPSAYFTRAIRTLRNIEKIYAILHKELVNPLNITLINEDGKERTIGVNLVGRERKINHWDEQFYRKYFNLIRGKEENYNLPEIYNQLFSLNDNIAYLQIPKMVDSDDAPKMFAALDSFMQKEAKISQALIVDVRSNSGGNRELIMELARYFVHPDSIHIVNVARQRGEVPLNNDLNRQLNNRYLFAFDKLSQREQAVVNNFNRSFEPMYQLDGSKFGAPYYCVLNGRKLSKGNHHYNKPIYILANERSFSAASVLVAIFKGLPNIQVVGVTTDGSSGNSERFELPNSKLRGKISTMVSFQKDGKILDGYGTKPDIVIERNLEQIYWERDYQLETLKEIIKRK